ncbi:MAG: hypothetical protein ACP5F8_03680 [Candidatus Aenigmatarchaeota archaeon]
MIGERTLVADIKSYIDKLPKNDDIEMRNKVKSIDPDKRKEQKINKSTMLYQEKKIKDRKAIRIYRKTVNKYGEE